MRSWSTSMHSGRWRQQDSNLQGCRSPELSCTMTHDSSSGIQRRSMTSARVLFPCMALALLLATTYAVKPRNCHWGSSQRMKGSDAVLAVGMIDSCSMPQDVTPSVLANVTAVLSIDCSYRLAQRHHGSGWAEQQQQHVPTAVPQYVLVGGLDAPTCMAIKAAALRREPAGGTQQMQQQQYMFLLAASHSSGTQSRHGQTHNADPTYQLVEYAPLPATGTDAAVAFFLEEWGALAQLGCHTSRSDASDQTRDSNSGAWGLGRAQRRHLLQDGMPPSNSPGPNPAQTSEASQSPEPSPAPADSLYLPLPSPSPSASGAKEHPPAGDEQQSNNLDGPGESNPGLLPGSSSNATQTSANITISIGVTRAAGPAEFQQQQALTSLLADSNRLNGTQDGSSASNRTFCTLPPATGPCRASIPRWAYDAEEGQCIEFTWGGCNGNDNRFETLQDCLAACSGVVISTSPGLSSPPGAQTSLSASIPAANSPAPVAAASQAQVMTPPLQHSLTVDTLPDQVIRAGPGSHAAPAASAASHAWMYAIKQLGMAAIAILVCSMLL